MLSGNPDVQLTKKENYVTRFFIRIENTFF
jgi:hypothetical protein